MIPVGRLAPGDQWDQNLLDQLFANKLYPTGLKFRRHEGYPNTEGCVLIVPGRYWHQHTDQITEAIARYDWCLAFRCGDEEDLFDISKVEHPNIRWWVQTSRTDRDYGDARLFGVGYPPHFNQLPQQPPDKGHPSVFLAAQKTHARRVEAFEALEVSRRQGGITFTYETEGFTQGLDADEYREMMCATQVAPAPSGAVSPDSFRFWEALEAHTVPIADTVSPVDGKTDYWRHLFPDAPFPVLENYSDLPGYIGDALRDWPQNANRITAWWMRQKRAMSLWLREDLEALGAL